MLNLFAWLRPRPSPQQPPITTVPYQPICGPGLWFAARGGRFVGPFPLASADVIRPALKEGDRLLVVE